MLISGTLTIVGKGIEMPNNRERGDLTTTSFQETAHDRAVNDADFRVSLLETAAEAVVSGVLDDAKAALRLYIKSTSGYEPVAALLGLHPKSLVRMLGSEGNPRSSNLVALLALSLNRENIRIDVKASRQPVDPALVSVSA